MAKNVNIQAGFLIDGSGDSIKQNVFLSIKNEKIIDIKTDRTLSDKMPLIDLSACTILPGFVDSHVHLFMSGTSDKFIRENQLKADFIDVKNVIRDHLQKSVTYGVVAVRDGGDSRAHTLKYKAEYLNANENPIILKTAGRAWRNKGRYGKLIGGPPRNDESLSQAILNCKEDTDHIKIVNSGLNSLKTFGKETAPQFTVQELTDAVNAACKIGKRVMVHANGKEPVQIAVKAGCDSIEHGFFMGADNIKLMAEHKVYWVPTACTMNGYAQHLERSSIEADIAEKNLDGQLEQIHMAKKAGVNIAVGTDAGSIGVHHGSSIIEELKLLMQAGYDLPQAVKCASYNGSRLLGLENTGVLKKGMKANFIAVNGTPENLPNSLNYIEKIFINGDELTSEV